jgi:hypothetical protein
MDLPWFKFSPASWMIGRISRQTPEVQVAFLRLCCVYWNEGCDLTFERAGLEAEESLEVLIRIRMVERSEDQICIKFLDEQFEEFKGKRSKQSLAGKASAEKRMKVSKKSKVQGEQKNIPESESFPGIPFDLFYSAYPRKTAKVTSEIIWKRLGNAERQKAIDGIRNLSTSDPKFIPYPSTYLNQRRWEDEPQSKESHEPTDRNEY